jgi:hypothetical protein
MHIYTRVGATTIGYTAEQVNTGVALYDCFTTDSPMVVPEFLRSGCKGVNGFELLPVGVNGVVGEDVLMLWFPEDEGLVLLSIGPVETKDICSDNDGADIDLDNPVLAFLSIFISLDISKVTGTFSVSGIVSILFFGCTGKGDSLNIVSFSDLGIRLNSGGSLTKTSLF